MADVEFTIEAIDKATGAINSIRDSWTEFNNKLRLVEGGIRTFNRFIDATVGKYIEYAEQVRAIQQLTGESAENVSRLIQLADDYKLSTDDLTTASRKLATEGLPLTVDTIAQLSDEYLKINDGADRQLFLMDNFGRNSIGWTEAMSAGSKEIYARNEAISAMLLLDQEAIDKAESYRLKMGDLKDAFLAQKIAIGEDLAPTLLTLIDYMTQVMEKNDETKLSWLQYIPVIGTIYQIYVNLATILEKVVGWLSLIPGLTDFAADVVTGVQNLVTPPPAPVISEMARAGGATRRAFGGYVSGRYAITGDSMSGRRTGYEELVDFQQKKVYSAPQTQAMGAVPRYAAGSGEIDLSYQTIQDLANAVAQKMSGYV